MSTATHTIDATHFTAPAPPVRTPKITQDCQGRVDQAAHPALHLADSGHGLRSSRSPWGRSSVSPRSSSGRT